MTVGELKGILKKADNDDELFIDFICEDNGCSGAFEVLDVYKASGKIYFSNNGIHPHIYS